MKEFLASAIEMKTSEPGVILVDHDDYDKNNSGYLALELPAGWEIKITKGVTMGDKAREFMEGMKWRELPDSAYFGILNDDFILRTPEWDKRLAAKLDGKNFVSSNGLEPDRRSFILPAVATAWSVGILKAVGFPIYPPGLQHLFIDNAWHCIHQRTGCWRMVASVCVEHKHVIFQKAEADETHKKVYAADAWAHDQDVFNKWMQADFPAACAAIYKLQGVLPSQRYNPSPSRNSVAPKPAGA